MDKKEKLIWEQVERRRKEARDNELTTADIAQLHGAAKLIRKYAHHLQTHVDAAVTNFESTDFDHVQFLADTKYILDNCGVIEDCTRIVKRSTKKMKMQIKED